MSVLKSKKGAFNLTQGPYVVESRRKVYNHKTGEQVDLAQMAMLKGLKSPEYHQVGSTSVIRLTASEHGCKDFKDIKVKFEVVGEDDTDDSVGKRAWMLNNIRYVTYIGTVINSLVQVIKPDAQFLMDQLGLLPLNIMPNKKGELTLVEVTKHIEMLGLSHIEVDSILDRYEGGEEEIDEPADAISPQKRAAMKRKADSLREKAVAARAFADLVAADIPKGEQPTNELLEARTAALEAEDAADEAEDEWRDASGISE